MSAKKSFILKLDTEFANECALQVISYFENRADTKVFSTNTDGGDLRISVRTPSLKEKNIFSMCWRPSKERFFCRLYLPYASIRSIGGVTDVRKPLSPTEPLLADFFYQPNFHNAVLIMLISAAVEECLEINGK
ncbi:MAG: hypothetical protein Q8O24_05425 [Gallionellaceae bacterium]|nr:hypothetical protein [Gallionellaceae bacterium]